MAKEEDTKEQDRNGRFNFEISEDHLNVFCSFHPSAGKGKELLKDDIIERLLDMGILESLIDKEKIDKCVQYANKSGKAIEKNIIATGKAPVPQIDKHIEIVFDPEDYIDLINRLLEEDKSRQIDYKNFSRLCLLNEDTIVAKVREKQEGSAGLSVKGCEIDFEYPRFKPISLGKNLIKKENGDIVSTCFGEYKFQRNTISINDVLDLRNGVNHETGNIRFPGSVVIHGEVQFDFKIHSDGNLMVHNTLGAADVYSGGNIVVVNGGIIGKDVQVVKAANVIKSVHIENAQVEAGSNIYIEKSSFNSRLHTNGLLHMGKGSKLLGCQVLARKGVVAKDIGNESSIRSTINCGNDIFIQDKIDKIRKYKEELIEEKDSLLKFDPMAETWEFNSKIKKCDQGIEQLQTESECDKTVRVEVAGTVFPGTEIKICDSVFQVTSQLSHGFFYYNRAEEKIMFQNH